LRALMQALALTPAEVAEVLERVRILDLTGAPFRLSRIEHDVVTPDQRSIEALVAAVESFKPDRLVLDPAISYGVGEQRVNDAEQGLIEATRIIRNQLDCCVELVHHVGKVNARERTLDQYTVRGGSALPDGSRMVAVLQSLTSEEWLRDVGTPLAPDAQGLVLALPKLSYCPPRAAIYISRAGWLFRDVFAAPLTPAGKRAAQADADRDLVRGWVRDEAAAGRTYSRSGIEAQRGSIGISRDRIRAALAGLLAESTLVESGTTTNLRIGVGV